MIMGIDYSMTSPAVCVYDERKGPPSKFNLLFFFLTDKRKYVGQFGIITGMKMPLYESQMERFDIISDWVMALIKRFEPDNVFIEGYSMGSKGRVFHIAENGGILKHKLWKAGIIFDDNLPPTSVKKLMTGKGNAKKEEMHDAFVEELGINVSEILSGKPKDSPVNDVVDSYAMVKYGAGKL